jgi:hypothetical protein
MTLQTILTSFTAANAPSSLSSSIYLSTSARSPSSMPRTYNQPFQISPDSHTSLMVALGARHDRSGTPISNVLFYIVSPSIAVGKVRPVLRYVVRVQRRDECFPPHPCSLSPRTCTCPTLRLRPLLWPRKWHHGLAL